MNLLARTLLGASLLLPATRAHAQHDASVWTEARVVTRAVTHAPEVRRALASLEESRARRAYAEVSAVGNPTVGLRAMVGAPDIPAATWALVVGVPFDVAGARGRRRGEVELGEREALARVEVAVNDARHRARAAWVDLGVAEEALRIAAARVETAAEVLQRVRARAAAQAATALDVALAEREAATALAERAVAARDRETASGRLRDVLDLAPTEPVAAPAPPPPALPEGSALAAVARASGALAEPRSFALAASRLRASASRLRAEAVSPLLLSGEVEWQGYAQSSVGVSAQWALPVARTAQGERAEALAAARTASLEGELRARALGREAAAAFEALRYASEELRALDADAVPAAERALSLTESLSDSGAVEFFRVLSARQELAAVRGRRVQALREAWRARLDLDRATAFDPLSRSAP